NRSFLRPTPVSISLKKECTMVRKLIIVLALALVLALSAACAPAPTLVPPTPVPPTSTSVPPTLPPPPTPVPPTATKAPTAAPTAVPGVPAASVEKLVNDTFNKVDRNLTLWNIQPGLGTVMIEYSNRLSRLWFAANAANWDMAKYQLDEMTEIQEVGETTRPARVPMLKAFEDKYLAALDKAILAKDKTAFTSAFNDAITGCNACHAASTGTGWKSYQYVKIEVPTIDPAPYVDWKGGGQDSYIANPPAAATAAPKPTLAGTLDAAGVSKFIIDKFNTVDRNLALGAIQPGLGTVMIEYADRYSRLFYSAKAGNWDMAKYQLDEMKEIQEVGETTRPGRAPMLQGFEKGFLDPLDKAILAKDAAAFDTAYKAVADGCNGCHAGSNASNWKSYKYVKIQAPTADADSYIAWKADKSTGSYAASASVAPTAAPKPGPSGAIDMIGAQKMVSDTINTVNRDLALWNIQPGLGTVMIEYAKRYAQLKYALDNGNWDMAKYQLDEMTEIQEVGETTRPGRAPMLKAFEDGFLKPMDAAILAKDKAKADAAYKNIIGGCNGCHAASTGNASTAGYAWKSYAFVQIQTPQSDPADYVQWNAGAGNTGNYVGAAPAGQPTTAAGGPPKIPASHVGRSQCLVCHATGVGGAPKPLPAIHSALADDPKICLGCHQQSQ
ncbi:MAG: hypothetical protein KGJ80_05090, partial [Chloroflexota bacterium]|nr:hypothetical protein [Chloroflexota bacterium]